MGMRTPLYDWHVAHQARMVDFGGWDMPVQYSTIMDEHAAVRSDAGIFDVSHMGRISFQGPDTLSFLQKVFTNNAATMKEMQVRYGLICNDQGGIRDDVLVYRWPYGWAMVVNAGNREKIVAWLRESMTGFQVELVDQTLDTCMIAVQGPRAVALCQGLTEADSSQLGYYHAAPTRHAGTNCIVSRTGYTGEDGLEFMVNKQVGVQLWEELVRRGARPCGLGARDTLRLEAAMPLYGHELTEDIDPFQAGLAWAVKMDKGDFRGRAALAVRQGNPLLRRRVGLELEAKRIAREGANLLVEGKTVGVVASGTFSPTLQKSIAMAYVDQVFTKPGTVLSVDLRGKNESARVVSLPFYKRKT